MVSNILFRLLYRILKENGERVFLWQMLKINGGPKQDVYAVPWALRIASSRLPCSVTMKCFRVYRKELRHTESTIRES